MLLSRYLGHKYFHQTYWYVQQRACRIESGICSIRALPQPIFFPLITKANGFQVLLQRFFTHLRTENAVSPHTISAYRDTFRILLRFMAEQRGVSIDQIPWEAFSPDTILAFLQHLETKRLNTARSRNARLAAIRAFVRFAIGYVSPDSQATLSAFLPFHANALTSPFSVSSLSTS